MIYLVNKYIRTIIYGTEIMQCMQILYLTNTKEYAII